MEMFCYQCEQTNHGTGCTIQGVCGKSPQVAALQELLVHATKGIAWYAHRAAQMGAHDRAVDVFTIESLFTTITNVNFDAARVAATVREAAQMQDRARKLYEDTARQQGRPVEIAAHGRGFDPTSSDDELVAAAKRLGVAARLAAEDATVVGLQELITYGLKGAAAYADHAQILGVADDAVFAEFHRLLDYVGSGCP